MKTKQLFLSLLLLSTSTFAQEVNYYFEKYTREYTDLSNPISVNNNLIWDDPSDTIPVGFEYNIFNNTSNQVIFYADFAGGILYSQDDDDKTISITASEANMADRAFTGDNEGAVGSLSPISYQRDGKIFKLEWKNAGFYNDASNNYYMNLQLWIYEGSNIIEIHYGSSNIPTDSVLYEDIHYSCGILEYYWDTDTEHGFFVEEGTDDYELGIIELDNPNWDIDYFNSIPENGTVFRFYPENAIGIEELKTGIKIHPNPATDVLYIENNEQLPMEYQVVSLDGRILKTGTSSEQKIQIDLSDLNTGMYFVRGTKNGNNFTKTISKI